MALLSTGQTLRASFAFMDVDPLPYVDVMESYFRCPCSNGGVYVSIGDDEYTVYFQEIHEDTGCIYRCVHPTRGWVFLSVR